MLERLENGVIEPLDKLVQNDFPEADQLMQLVQQVIADKSLSERLPAAEAALDRILSRCATILAAMRKLESFNEAVAILRKIIEDEQGLIDKTKKELRSKVLDPDPPQGKQP